MYVFALFPVLYPSGMKFLAGPDVIVFWLSIYIMRKQENSIGSSIYFNATYRRDDLETWIFRVTFNRIIRVQYDKTHRHYRNGGRYSAGS